MKKKRVQNVFIRVYLLKNEFRFSTRFARLLTKIITKNTIYKKMFNFISKRLTIFLFDPSPNVFFRLKLRTQLKLKISRDCT